MLILFGYFDGLTSKHVYPSAKDNDSMRDAPGSVNPGQQVPPSSR